MKPLDQRRNIQCLQKSIHGFDIWLFCDVSQLEPGDVFRIVNNESVVILFNGHDRIVFKKHFILASYLSADVKPTLWNRIKKALTPPVAI